MGINWILIGAVTAGIVAAILIGFAYLLFEIPRAKPGAGTPEPPRAPVP